MKTSLPRLPSPRTACKDFAAVISWGLLISAVLAGLSTLGAQEPQQTPPGSRTLEDIIKLSKSGVADEVIITLIKSNGKAFDLNSDEILELKNSGVSQTVIEYLIDPKKPYTPPAPTPNVAPPPAPPPKPPSDPLALKLPPDPGLYYLTNGRDFSSFDLKPVVPSKQPGKLSKLSGGLLKGHIIGSVVGSKSKNRVLRPTAIFYLRLEDKATIDDFALLRLEPSSTRRDLDFGTKPGKPMFPLGSRVQFESKQVATGLFRLSVGSDKPGEYLFFVLGSGDDKKGLLGKGYDFGVD